MNRLFPALLAALALAGAGCISVKTEHEVKVKVSDTPISTEEERTQRQTVALQDVRYRITAQIMPQKGFQGNPIQLYEQALRRIETGKCFYQPCLGLREFAAYFEPSDGLRRPIPVDMDAGWMVYDVFDLWDPSVQKKVRPQLSLFHAVMQQGVVEVPPYNSPDVIRGGDALC